MKKLICLAIALLMLTLLVPPQKVEAWSGPGWFLPGLIVGGAIGWSLAPHYYYYPPPGYSYPAPPSPNPPPQIHLCTVTARQLGLRLLHPVNYIQPLEP